MTVDLKLVEKRHDVSPEILTRYIADNFVGNLLTLRQLEPFISEVKRRFKILPRKKDITGNYKTIYGCRTFKAWCLGVLHRSDRTVRYMLAKAHGDKKKNTVERAETISAVSSRILAHIERQTKKFTEDERSEILAALVGKFGFIGRESKD